MIAVVLVQHNTSKKTLQDVFPSLDDTVSVELNSQNVPNYPVVTCTITDPQQVQELITRIKNMPIRSEEKVETSSGWTYWMRLYDAEENELLNGVFNSDYLSVTDGMDSMVYTTDKGYFQFLIDLADSGEPME